MRNHRIIAAILTFTVSVCPLSYSHAETLTNSADTTALSSSVGPTVGTYSDGASSVPETTGGSNYPAALETAEETVQETKSYEEILLEQQALEQARLAALAMHAADIGNYYKDSVLIGDSVAMGFSLYAARNATAPIFQNLKFLTRGSYSVHNAFSKITSKSTHPIYGGEQHYIWDSIKLVNAKHVYSFFGLNDLYDGVDYTVQKYLQLLDKIKTENPDVDFTIVSTTPMYKGSEKKNLNNANIRALNEQMKALAAVNGWGFIDVATPLTDSTGYLAPKYCSDKYVHQTNSAYAVWQQTFEQYAEQHLKDGENEEEIKETRVEESAPDAIRPTEAASAY
ncbi:GDSL-type esterase/lipase family protein [Oribacterium sp. P6A1]|uniref:GDSL-type esterase/lipase family protein n=1 Tax=Oribacterium sp. P6A1 TaxID=1410612 RepID=UPI00068E31DC|nr:GDSL-type esterase/lipase family protein [Oribacterium sp. P6A1]